MKKKSMFLALMLIVMLSMVLFAPPPAQAATTPEVCGNSFMFFSDDDVAYLGIFTSSNPELPCTGGTAYFYWLGQMKAFNFTVKNSNIVKVTGMGKFVVDEAFLYMLDSSVIKFALLGPAL